MKKITLTLCTFLIISCASNKKSIYLKKYELQFKEISFCECIYNGYNDMDNQLAKKMKLIDKSFNKRIVYALSGDIISNIVKKEAQKMKKDSLNSISTVAEFSAGKKVIHHCIRFYKSKILDSTARLEYKRLKKIKNIDSIIMEKLPDY